MSLLHPLSVRRDSLAQWCVCVCVAVSSPSSHHGRVTKWEHFPGAASGARYRLLLSAALAGRPMATGQNLHTLMCTPLSLSLSHVSRPDITVMVDWA